MTQFQFTGLGSAKAAVPLEAGAFIRKMNKHKALAEERFIVFQKRVAFELFRRIILKTPVDTGRARNGWTMTIGSPAETAPIDGDADLIAKFSEALTLLAKYDEPGIIWITNNVNYIRFLEQGKPGPGSQQAPQGMVAVSLKEVVNDL